MYFRISTSINELINATECQLYAQLLIMVNEVIIGKIKELHSEHMSRNMILKSLLPDTHQKIG